METLYTFDGNRAGDGFGGSVAGAGDVNKDGYDDFVVGIEGDDTNATSSGSAQVFSGATGEAGRIGGDADLTKIPVMLQRRNSRARLDDIIQI